ncbi:MAG: hypothetical protein GX605_00720 [Chloroflexi bacterium]|nr:hypothetical protein [Chloroflexota bacterium]
MSDASDVYTALYRGSRRLLVGTTTWLELDAWLCLPTTSPTAIGFAHSHPPTNRPTTAVASVRLLGGDGTDDHMVDITDAACIGRDYGSTPGACGLTGTSDIAIAGDGLVDILDRALMGGDYGLDASPWTR